MNENESEHDDNQHDAAEYLAQSIRSAIRDTERRYGVYVYVYDLRARPVHRGEYWAVSLAANVWEEAMRIIEAEPTSNSIG